MSDRSERDAESCPTRNRHRGTVVGILALATTAGYFAAYRSLALVDVIVLPVASPAGTTARARVPVCQIVHYDPVPDGWQPLCRVAFAPAEWIDRRLRPYLWMP